MEGLFSVRDVVLLHFHIHVTLRTMQNTNRSLHYAFASIAFLVALITFLLTVQPTVPFWDCGEFTAAAVQQQVPHPPGAPLFLMLGKLFHLLPFGDPGWRINLVSVVASAFTVVLLYLITVRVIRNFFTEDLGDLKNALLVYGSAFVAALTYTFTDTFWFNAVESEVYAASSLFVAIIVHLMMVWNEKADEEGSEKYLLLIAYMIGLSIGVHLLSILTIFSLVLLIYLRKYPFKTSTLLMTIGIGLVTFYVVYTLVIMKLPALFAGNLPFKNDAREFLVEGNGLFTLIGIGLLLLTGFGVYYGKKTNHGVLSLVASSILLIVLGYSTYGHILVRANSNPPMNENKPEDFSKLVSYLGREQYGEAPSWPRRYQSEQRFVNNYLKYGPWQRPPVKVVTRKDGTRMQMPDFGNWKTDGKSRYSSAEFAYMWDYQINQMYIRYFLWNFMGRVSDVQDAPAYSPFTDAKTVEVFNHKNGFGEHFPINYWAIPLILGLVGLVLHFSRDKKMATIYLILFLMTGVLAAIQQNQQNPQPRERDYFYVASFMVYAMWVGMGAFAILEKLKNNVAAVGGGLVALLVVSPLNLATQNWFTHSRAGNYLAFDYAYNILQSLEKDAIVFTNGDNDTFPVWYLQDVAGVRQDVRVVNLSLGQTLWYIEQLKNREPHGAKKIPLSFTDKQLLVSEEDPNALTYEFGPGSMVEIPVDRATLAKFTTDSSVIASGTFKWYFTGGSGRQGADGTPEYFIGVQHKLVRDILVQTKFERPVYFCTSIGDPSYADEFVGLGPSQGNPTAPNYLRLEGMAYRVCPAPQPANNVDDAFMYDMLMKPLAFEEQYTSQHFGLKFRNLNNKNVYYDDVRRGYIMNYRNVFYKYVRYLLTTKNDPARAGKVLKQMNDLISLDLFPLSADFELEIGRLFDMCGMPEEAQQMGVRALASSQDIMKSKEIRERERINEDGAQAELLLAESASLAGNYAIAKATYQQIASRTRGVDPLLSYKMDELDVLKLERAKDLNGALAKAEGLRSKYSMAVADRRSQEAAMELEQKISALQKRLGRSPQAVLSMTP